MFFSRSGFVSIVLTIIFISVTVLFLIYKSIQTINESNPRVIIYNKGSTNSEIWMMDNKGSNQVNLNLGENLNLLNNITSDWIYYTVNEDKMTNGFTLHAFNYLTKQRKQISELNPPGGFVNVGYFIVSPDNKKILYQISYTKPVNGSPKCGQESCPSLDLYPEYKTGTYVYDIETDKKIYLGQLGYGAFWSLDSHSVFNSFDVSENYHEYNREVGSYSINIINAESTLIRPIKDQVFGFYRLYPTNNNKEWIVAEQLKNINGGAGDYVLKVNKDELETVIDSGNLCLTFSCFSISPGSKHAFYLKGDNNVYPNNVILVDLSTFKIEVILKASNEQSFGSPIWISDSQIVVESTTDNKTNLLLFDINTKQTKTLTTSGDVNL